MDGCNVAAPSKEDVWSKIATLFKDRIIYDLQQKPGSTERMILDAVLASSCDDMGDVIARFEEIKGMYKSKADNLTFRQACKTIERSGNIVKSAKIEINGAIDPELFQDDLEGKVFQLYNDTKNEIDALIVTGAYRKALSLYADTFFDTLHQFFEKIMINVEDAKVRENRLLLMKNINTLITKEVADLRLVHGVVIDS